MSEIAISVKVLEKSFQLPHERYTGLKQALINFRPGKKSYEQQRVLRGVSFDIKKGEFFGIVGRNGSGKSTLLKLLAQIYTPDAGAVEINGSLTPFIELGVGFNPELTGHENIFLNGALLGFDHKQVEAMYDDIVNFAELERFMDQKLKNYSSGMQVRLAFSIAIRAQSDILLLDEVLAVGDTAFQEKCFNYFEQLKREGKTVVLVSHDMSAVKQFCDKAVLIDRGEVKLVGDPLDVALEYDRLNYAEAPDAQDGSSSKSGIQIETLNDKEKPATKFEYGQDILLRVKWPEGQKVNDVGFVIFKGSEAIFATNSIGQDYKPSGNQATLRLKPKFGNGRYRVTVGLFGDSRHDVVGHDSGLDILIYDQPIKGPAGDEWEGLFYTENKWL